MKISNELDFNRKRSVLILTSNLFRDYFGNFTGMIKSSSEELPPGLEIQRGNNDSTVILSYPMPALDLGGNESPEGGFMKVGIPMDVYAKSTSSLTKFIEVFVESATKYMLSRREFLPLYEYPIDDLKKDVVNALENKRDLIVIDKYSTYLENQKKGELKFNQCVVKYDTDKSLYSDTVLLITQGKISEWRKLFEKKLVFTEWV